MEAGDEVILFWLCRVWQWKSEPSESILETFFSCVVRKLGVSRVTDCMPCTVSYNYGGLAVEEDDFHGAVRDVLHTGSLEQTCRSAHHSHPEGAAYCIYSGKRFPAGST